MCDNTAVRWNEYDTVMSQRDSETRHKIANEIQQYISRSREARLNNHFISGLELAYSIALGLNKGAEKVSDELDNATLF